MQVNSKFFRTLRLSSYFSVSLFFVAIVRNAEADLFVMSALSMCWIKDPRDGRTASPRAGSRYFDGHLLSVQPQRLGVLSTAEPHSSSRLWMCLSTLNNMDRVTWSTAAMGGLEGDREQGQLPSHTGPPTAHSGRDSPTLGAEKVGRQSHYAMWSAGSHCLPGWASRES